MNPRKDYSPLEVTVRDPESPGDLDRAWKRFCRMVSNEKVIKDWKRKQRFEKPSETRRRKLRDSARRRRKEEKRRARMTP